MDSPIPSQELLSDQDLDFQDQLPYLLVQWLLSTTPLLVHQAIGLPHTHLINALIPHRLISPQDLILILSKNLIAFLNLIKSLVSRIVPTLYVDCNKFRLMINYFEVFTPLFSKIVSF